MVCSQDQSLTECDDVLLLVVVGLRSLLSCWLLARGSSQLLEIICISWLMYISSLKSTVTCRIFLPFCHWVEKFFSFVIRLDYIQACVICYLKVNCTVQNCVIMAMRCHYSHYSHILEDHIVVSPGSPSGPMKIYNCSICRIH